MTLDQIAYNLLDTIEGGRGTNNEHYSLEQIKFQILYYRALFLRQDDQYDNDKEDFQQEFQMELEVVPTAEDYDSSFLSDYATYVLRSTTSLPQTVSTRNTYGLDWVGTPGFKGIPLKRHYQVRHVSHSRHTKCDPRAFVRNSRLYIINDPGVRQLGKKEAPIIQTHAVVRGVFVDPRQVSGFNETTDDFPIGTGLVQRITDGLIGGELRFMREKSSVMDLEVVPDDKGN